MYEHAPTMPFPSTLQPPSEPNVPLHKAPKPKFCLAPQRVLRAALNRGHAIACSWRSRNSSALVAAASVNSQHARAARYYEKREMPTDAVSLERILDYSALATHLYYQNESLPHGWRLDEATLHALAGDLPQALAGNFNVRNCDIVDFKSGLTARVFLHPVERICVLGFGGTTSGTAAVKQASPGAAPGGNFKMTMHQWRANANAALGITPVSYKQAALLAQALQRLLALDARYEGYTLRLTGHSKGGGEAMYAALKADTPMHATVFSPAHLSAGLIAELPLVNLERAPELIESYTVRGDPIPALRGRLPGMEGLGSGYRINGIPGKSALHRHSYAHRHFKYHMSNCTAGQFNGGFPPACQARSCSTVAVTPPHTTTSNLSKDAMAGGQS
jgi:hypothetical protein